MGSKTIVLSLNGVPTYYIIVSLKRLQAQGVNLLTSDIRANGSSVWYSGWEQSFSQLECGQRCMARIKPYVAHTSDYRDDPQDW